MVDAMLYAYRFAFEPERTIFAYLDSWQRARVVRGAQAVGRQAAKAANFGRPGGMASPYTAERYAEEMQAAYKRRQRRLEMLRFADEVQIAHDVTPYCPELPWFFGEHKTGATGSFDADLWAVCAYDTSSVHSSLREPPERKQP